MTSSRNCADPGGERTSRSALLSEDARARVEIVPIDGRDVVQKVYLSPLPLRWRTLFRRSRAAREFANLAALRAAGVPCVGVIGWSEKRRMGCVTSSTLLTEYLPDARDLQSTIRSTPAHGRRSALATALGKLLCVLHEQGFCSTTASPRNVLVDPSDELVLIDQPHLVRLPAGPLQRRLAEGDLYDALFSPRRLLEWSRVERWRALRAYCKEDRSATRATWSRLTRRRRWALRLERTLCRILGNLRRPRAPSPTT